MLIFRYQAGQDKARLCYGVNYRKSFTVNRLPHLATEYADIYKVIIPGFLAGVYNMTRSLLLLFLDSVNRRQYLTS